MNRNRIWSTSRRGVGEALRASNFPMRTALLMWSALLVLALGTSWLLQRGDSLGDAARQTARGRSLAELVAQAVGSDVTFEDSSRFLRILECAGRDENLLAGAVIDRTGAVVAHTDVSRTGMRVDLPVPSLEDAPAVNTQATGLVPELFGATRGQIYLYPLIGPDGPVGTVALLLAPARPALFGRDALRFFLPAGLLLLAFVGLMQATIRWAFRPTSEFLERLTRALERKDGAEAPGTRSSAPEQVMEEAVSSVHALSRAKQDLTIENRVLDYAKRRMALILDQLPDGLLMTDPQEQPVFTNRVAATLLAVTRGEAEDEGRLTLSPESLGILREAHRNGQVLLPATADGRQTLVHRVPLAGPGGQAAGTLFVLRDVTAQQAAQQAQAEFLAQITHELKAPLNTIVAYVEALADEDLLSATERREFLNTLNDEALRMAQLISNLLQLSRIQLGSLSAQFGFVKAEALIRERAEALRTQAEARSQTLAVELPENLPPLYGDKDLLGVALTNLITNAIKYTPAGGRITVRAVAGEHGLDVEVEDTGIGIPAEARQKIFERFARSEQEEVRRETGSGLGLALVKEIVELHDGQVTVESELGRGSRFRLRLPVREVGTRLDLAA
jgi:two-component system, OmpR family, phosphate regulon sensor histidine kinase PhoR